MNTLVLPLGSLPTGEGPLFALVARHEGGLVTLGAGPSWAAAAEQLATKLSGTVRCGPALALHGQRHGWQAVQPTEAEFLAAAAFALLIEGQYPPGAEQAMNRFAKAWAAFYRLRLWEQLPAELSLHTRLRRGTKSQDTCLAVMGQAGQEYGLAHYEDPAAFDAMWSGDPFTFDGLSVLASDAPYLAPAFEPLGVPPPALTWVHRSKPKAPRPADYAMAAAAMELLVGVLHGELGPLPAGDGATLELKRDEAPKKERAAKKKPRSKK